MIKVFKVADIHRLIKQVTTEEITYSRMVEIMNEMSNEAHSESQKSAMPCVRISLLSVDQIEKDIKSCYETRWSGCSQWCGSDDCSPDCSNSIEYEELNRDKFMQVIERWRNEA